MPPPEQATEVNKRFRATAPSVLYFKNIRSSYYTSTQDPETRIDYYSLRKWRDADSPIYPVIAHDWLHDAAYIQLISNNFEPIELQIGDATKTLKLDMDSLEKSTAIALQINNALKNQESISILHADNTPEIILEDTRTKTNFLITINDYLRLVEQQ